MLESALRLQIQGRELAVLFINSGRVIKIRKELVIKLNPRKSLEMGLKALPDARL